MAGRSRVEFINLGQAGAALENAVARLAAFHHRAGSRVLIHAADPGQAARLDEALWTFDPDAFVPHAVEGGPDAAREPVLITFGPSNPNQAGVLIMAAPRPSLEAGQYGLIIDFVPAEPGPALDAARERYRAAQGAEGVELHHITDLP